MKRIVVTALVMVGLIGLAWLLTRPVNHPHYYDPGGNYYYPDQKLKLGFEKPGVDIVVRSWDEGYNARAHYRHLVVSDNRPDRSMCVSRKGHLTALSSPWDLHGSILIRTPGDALQYVRLSTTPPIHELWFTTHYHEFEVIPVSMFRSLKTYGGHGQSPDGVDTVEAQKALATPDGWSSGTGGILSDAAFRQAGFQQPQVSRTGAHFTVKRWIFIVPDDWLVPYDPAQESYRQEFAKYSKLELIQETVNADGSYRRKVLRTQKCPNLPGTTWEDFLFGYGYLLP